ncbi:glycoside hydrolase family 19 protein [Flavobacteriaceae bacterium MHTCC 0001]
MKKVFPNASDDNLKKIADAINKRAKDFGINTKEKLRHFLAQAGHESANFTKFEENLNYRWKDLGTKNWKKYFNPIATPEKDTSKEDPNDYKKSETSTSPFVDNEKFANHVYGGRMGNNKTGDGYKFRGRGIIQLTGKNNYQSFTNFYKDKYDKTKDFIKTPDLLASDLEIGIISALWYFKNRVMNKVSIDNNTSVTTITKKVNGGTHGLKDREEIHTKAKKDIDCK